MAKKSASGRGKMAVGGMPGTTIGSRKKGSAKMTREEKKAWTRTGKGLRGDGSSSD